MRSPRCREVASQKKIFAAKLHSSRVRSRRSQHAARPSHNSRRLPYAQFSPLRGPDSAQLGAPLFEESAHNQIQPQTQAPVRTPSGTLQTASPKPLTKKVGRRQAARRSPRVKDTPLGSGFDSRALQPQRPAVAKMLSLR